MFFFFYIHAILCATYFIRPLCSFLLLVGNIPYEATEEKLKDIFSEVGPVISFKYNTLKNLFIVNYNY